MAFLHRPDIQKENEAPPLLTPEELTYKGLIRQIALTVIKNNHTEFAKLSWLKDSPLISVAPFIEEIDHNPSMTSIGSTPMSKEGDELFAIAFRQLCALAHVDEKTINTLLTKAGLMLIKKTLVRPANKTSASFEQTFIADEKKALEGKIPPENSITRENGVHWQNCEWIYDTKEASAKKLQLSLATGLAYFLRNQANMAGHINHNTPSLEDKEYAKFIKKTYFEQVPNSRPPKLKIHWDIVAPGPLGTELKRLMPDIPEYSDNDVSDMTAYFPEGSTVPATRHPDFNALRINALTVPLLHPNGRHYLMLGVKDILSMSPAKLGELFSYPTNHDLHFVWQSITELRSTVNHPFALRMDWISRNHPILPFEHNITNFLNITCDPTNNRAKLEWRSGHFPSDGAIRNEAIKTFAKIIKNEILPPNSNFIQHLKNENGQSPDLAKIQKSRSLKDLLTTLGLDKVIIGTTFESTALARMVDDYNHRFLKPQDDELSQFIKNNPLISQQIASLLHNYSNVIGDKQPPVKDDINRIAQRRVDVINQISAVLNPHLSSVDAIAVASEYTCTSAVCALPYSRLRRLATYASDHINTTIRSVKTSFDLTVRERVLSKLGLGWQSVLAITVQGKENLSKHSAKRIHEKLLSSSLPPRQISDLGPGFNNNFFITALSAKIDELAAGIGVSGDYLTERVDLEKPDFLSSLPLHKPLMDLDINLFAKLYKQDEAYIIKQLTLVNSFLQKNNQSDPLTILKSIAVLEPNNPSQIIEYFLLANIYRELRTIPIQAISYVSNAIFGK